MQGILCSATYLTHITEIMAQYWPSRQGRKRFCCAEQYVREESAQVILEQERRAGYHSMRSCSWPKFCTLAGVITAITVMRLEWLPLIRARMWCLTEPVETPV